MQSKPVKLITNVTSARLLSSFVTNCNETVSVMKTITSGTFIMAISLSEHVSLVAKQNWLPYYIIATRTYQLFNVVFYPEIFS